LKEVMSTGLLLLLSLIFEACLSHKRLFWPIPRQDRTASTSVAPCGGTSFEQAYRQNRTTDLNAGDTIDIIIFEQIRHLREPMRLAISGPNNEDFESCIWLNQIPQHTLPNEPRNLTIRLTVPDFTCKNCTLQMLAFQTDIQDFETDSTCCAYNSNDTKTCPLTQYYSCANININGGSRSRSDVCVQPSGWANRDLSCNYYRSMASTNAWEMVSGSNTTLRLKTSGSIDGLPSADTHCMQTNEGQIPFKTNCHRTATAATELGLFEGGELQTDGAIAIVVVVLLVTVIGATLCITKKKGIRNSNETDSF